MRTFGYALAFVNFALCSYWLVVLSTGGSVVWPNVVVFMFIVVGFRGGLACLRSAKVWE